MRTSPFWPQILKRAVALPSDHGAWVFISSPLLIGAAAGGRLLPATGWLVGALLAGFLLRQPISILVKVYSGRRPPRELTAAWFWCGVYSLVGLACAAALALLGFGFLLGLAIPALPVFAWHLWLVSRREERRQAGVEIVGSGVLALAAPAAYWIGAGSADPTGWLLFLLVWFQSAASIVYAYLRLDQREWKALPSAGERLRRARRALLYTGFNLAGSLALSALGLIPTLVFIPHLIQWLETVWGAFNPSIGWKPTAIGVRQLVVSTLFTLVFMLTWR